jgi:hypothetical protein
MESKTKPIKPSRSGIWSEYLYFLRNYKMWWLLPVFAVVTVLGLLVVLAGSKGALLIYALF